MYIILIKYYILINMIDTYLITIDHHLLLVNFLIKIKVIN